MEGIPRKFETQEKKSEFESTIQHIQIEDEARKRDSPVNQEKTDKIHNIENLVSNSSSFNGNPNHGKKKVF